MRKILAVLLALCMVLSIGGMALAEEEEPTERTMPLTLMEGSDYLYDETESGFYMSVRIPAVFVSEEEAETFQDLQKAFDGFNAELRADAEETFKIMKENATEDLIQSGDYDGFNSESWVEYHRAGDADAVSILVYSCMDLGGPHPSHTYTARTFDCMSGDVIPLGEIIKDTDQLAKILADQLKAESTDEDEFLVDDLEAAIKERIDDGSLVWTVDYQGMSFYFPQEDLTCYAAGSKTAFIPFGINADIFNDVSYIGTSADEYVLSMAADRELYFMLDENAPANCIYVSSQEDSEGNFTELDVFVDDIKTGIPCDFFYMDSISLVHVGEKNYLYVVTSSENDYSELLVLEINKDKTVTEKGTVSYTGLHSQRDQNGYLVCLGCFDPMNFALDTAIDVLSTTAGYRSYEAGEDGVPVPLENAYTIIYPFTLTLKQNLAGVTVLDEMTGEAAGTTDLEAGDYVTIEKVDPVAMTIEAELTDARTVQFTYSMEEDAWPILVNGVDAETLFDGMVYAG